MAVFLKRKLKQILIGRQHRLYAEKVAAKKLTYDKWIQKKETELEIQTPVFVKNESNLKNEGLKADFGGKCGENEGNYSRHDELCQFFTFSDQNCKYMEKRLGILISNSLFCKNMDAILEEQKFDLILLALYEGAISEIALNLICEKFLSQENIILIYGDEDVEEEGVRKDPWFKPDWSPDRFLSGFYFGALTAVRGTVFREAYFHCRERLEGAAAEERLYLLLYEMLEKNHAFGKGHDSAGMPVCHIPEVLFHSRAGGYEQIKQDRLPDRVVREWTKRKSLEIPKKGVLVSVIIPSKDNPRVLFQCLDTLLKKTKTKYSFQVIVVDNGSCKDNRRQIESGIAHRAGLGEIRYFYRPMEFNFSRMCNLGAEQAEGQLLLFLNDDMEIIQPDWMDLMAEKALLPYAGAVGVKLLYPDSHRIQHAGITNLRVGPAHKLQFLNDREVHYFGMNRGVHNMLAVTGACLMVKKQVFLQAGGFFEGLAVAFNDVDLCYTIYELGYYNIVRNDVVLYHHESLSRGKDGESQEKQFRLLKEKDMLYERHQELYGKDPFYSPSLTTDMLESEYTPACRYQVTLDMPWSQVKEAAGQIEKAREDQCLVVGMECAMDLYKWKYGVSPEKGKVKETPEDMGYYFQGYSFVIGSDNACYRKKLLLKNRENGRIWEISVEERYRQDIRQNLKDQLNVDLTGFAAKVHDREIPAGMYQFGMLAEDRCSRQKLVNWSSWVLEKGH